MELKDGRNIFFSIRYKGQQYQNTKCMREKSKYSFIFSPT